MIPPGRGQGLPPGGRLPSPHSAGVQDEAPVAAHRRLCFSRRRALVGVGLPPPAVWGDRLPLPPEPPVHPGALQRASSAEPPARDPCSPARPLPAQ